MRWFPLFVIAMLEHICTMGYAKEWAGVVAFSCISLFAQAQMQLQRQGVLPLQQLAYTRSSWNNSGLILSPAAVSDSMESSLYLLGENRFMLRELTHFQTGLLLPLQDGAIKLNAFLEQNPLRKMVSFDAGYAMRINSQLSTGINIGLEKIRMQGNKPSWAITAGGGIIHALQNGFVWGLHFISWTPLAPKATGAESLQGFALAAGYTLSEGLLISAELTRRWNGFNRNRMTLNWKATRELSFHGGFDFPEGNLNIGVTQRFSKQLVSIGFSSHGQLGISGALLFVYGW